MDELQYATLTCPIEGCTWSVTTPFTASLRTYAIVFGAAEVLAHLTGRRVDAGEAGYPQERTHDVRVVNEIGLPQILEAAGIEWERVVGAVLA